MATRLPAPRSDRPRVRACLPAHPAQAVTASCATPIDFRQPAAARGLHWQGRGLPRSLNAKPSLAAPDLALFWDHAYAFVTSYFVDAVAFSTDGRISVTGNSDGTVGLLEC